MYYKLGNDWSDITPYIFSTAKLIGRLTESHYNLFIKEIPDFNFLSWLESEIQVLFEIIPGTTCSKCNGSLPAEKAQCYCHCCKISFCENCFEAAHKNEAIARLVHKQHKLLCFKMKNPSFLKGLDLNMLGYDIFATIQKELTEEYITRCISCQKMIVCTRFICLTCYMCNYDLRFYNYCQECINIFKNPDNLKYKDFKYLTSDHFHEDHVYLTRVYVKKINIR